MSSFIHYLKASFDQYCVIASFSLCFVFYGYETDGG